MREDTNDFEDQNDEFSFEAGPMQMEAVNVNGQEDPLAATGFIPLSPELPALSNMSRWYQDEVSTRLFLDGDNQDIALMEKQCLRGGLPLGSYLKSGSVKEKSSIYQKTYLVVAYMKSKSGVPNVKANHRVRSFGASMRFHGTLGLGKTMQESNFHEAAFAFGCGAMERLWMSSNTEKSSVGLIADLFVSNQFRRQNVGSRVIQDLEGKMKRVGATIIFSRVPKRNREAMTLFNKHGFVRMIDIQITLWKTSVSPSLKK